MKIFEYVEYFTKKKQLEKHNFSIFLNIPNICKGQRRSFSTVWIDRKKEIDEFYKNMLSYLSSLWSFTIFFNIIGIIGGLIDGTFVI